MLHLLQAKQNNIIDVETFRGLLFTFVTARRRDASATPPPRNIKRRQNIGGGLQHPKPPVPTPMNIVALMEGHSSVHEMTIAA